MTDCYKIIKDLAGDAINGDDIDAVIRMLEGERDARRASGNLADADEFVRQAGIDLGTAEQIAKRREQYAAYKNILVRRDLWSRVREADKMVDDPSLGIRSALGGVNAPIENARYSVDSLGVSLSQEAQGAIAFDMKKAGVLTQFNSMKGDFEDEVARKIADLNSANPIGVKVSEDARKIAEIMVRHSEAMRGRLNAEGAFIRKLDGRIVAQTHDQWRIDRIGADKWKAETRNRLDFRKMGIRPDEEEAFMDSAYDAISTGIRLDDVSKMTDDEVKKLNDIFARAFKGTRNIARKVSASRTLVFKTPEDAMAYNRAFGAGSLRESYIGEIGWGARNVAMMRILGHNPEAMIDSVVRQAEREYRGQKDKLAKLKGGVANIDHMVAEATGRVNLTETSKQARAADISSGISLIHSMSKLGSSIISVIPDLAINASSRMYQGRSLMGAWRDTFLTPIEGLSGGEKREVAEALRAGIDGMIGATLSRYNAADHFSGRMAKTAHTFFKFNLMTPYTDIMQRGATLILSRDLGGKAGKAFDDLPPATQRLLRIYGLTGRNWEIARQAVKEADGEKYIMPGDVEDVRGGVFTGMSEDQQARLRRDVQERLWTLLKSEAEMGIIEPGLTERAILRRGTSRGSAVGVALRQMALFKSFGVTVLSKGLGRQIYGSGAKNLRDAFTRGMGENLGLVNLIVGTTMLGYVSYQLKEISKGREPREASPQMFIAAMMQGGGLGLYGDFLFAEYNRFGGGPLASAMGPTATTLADAVSIINKAQGFLEEGKTDLTGDIARLVKNNIPFQNLLYTKGAFDYLIWYQFQEAMNPGYLKRMERRVERENNQQYWLPPSSIVARGGGFR